MSEWVHLRDLRHRRELLRHNISTVDAVTSNRATPPHRQNQL